MRASLHRGTLVFFSLFQYRSGCELEFSLYSLSMPRISTDLRECNCHNLIQCCLEIFHTLAVAFLILLGRVCLCDFCTDCRPYVSGARGPSAEKQIVELSSTPLPLPFKQCPKLGKFLTGHSQTLYQNLVSCVWLQCFFEDCW